MVLIGLIFESFIACYRRSHRVLKQQNSTKVTFAGAGDYFATPMLPVVVILSGNVRYTDLIT